MHSNDIVAFKGAKFCSKRREKSSLGIVVAMKLSAALLDEDTRGMWIKLPLDNSISSSILHIQLDATHNILPLDKVDISIQYIILH